MKYQNPIIPWQEDLFPGRQGDPYILKYKDFYYHCFYLSNDDSGVYLTKVKNPADIGKATPTKVFDIPKEGIGSLFYAPELHFVDGDFYIHGAPIVKHDGDRYIHAMRVLRCKGDDPMGTYEDLGAVEGIGDVWSIDGTIFYHGGKRYYIWASGPIFIAEMLSPTKISSEKTLLVECEYDWEMVMNRITEGPAQIEHNGRNFLAYSVNDCRCDNYCVGFLELVGDNPLDVNCWKKHPEPILYLSDKVYGPGHCSFAKIGDDDWCFYHANLESGTGSAGRSVWMQKVDWSKGYPFVGTPAEEVEY